MLIIQKVEYSKNPVLINEAFLISVTVCEQTATWNDVKAETCGNLKNINWLKVKLKDF